MSRAVGFVFFMSIRKLFLDSKTQRHRDAKIVLEFKIKKPQNILMKF